MPRLYTTNRPYLLVGIDYEGDTRESSFDQLPDAISTARECSTPGRFAWLQWEIWGNAPDWRCIESG